MVRFTLLPVALLLVGCPDELCSQASVDWDFSAGASGLGSHDS